MILASRSHRRSGATAVECAFVYPIVFLLVVGIVVGALGIFRYQEMAHLAREASRYASVHGTNYAQDTGNPPATAQDIYNNAISPNMTLLDPNQLAYTVTWSPSNQPLVVNNSAEVPTASTVTVTLTYQWVPEFFFTAPITLTSTSTVQMQY